MRARMNWMSNALGVLGVGLSVVATGTIAGCGSDGASAAGEVAQPVRPEQIAASPPAAAPMPALGSLGPASMWARQSGGRGGGGGGGSSRPLGQTLIEQQQAARERAFSHLSDEQRDQYFLEHGQALSQERLSHLREDERAGVPTQGGSPSVEERCATMYAMQEDTTIDRGAYMRRCQSLDESTWGCIDRDEEANEDPECRRRLQPLRASGMRFQRRAQEIAHPARRVDELVEERWETERAPVAPDELAPDHVAPMDREPTPTSGGLQGELQE